MKSSMEADTIYNADGVNVIQHGGSLYVTGQNGGGWKILSPLGKLAANAWGKAKDQGLQYLSNNEAAIKQAALDASKRAAEQAIKKGKKVIGLGIDTDVWNALSPDQREALMEATPGQSGNGAKDIEKLKKKLGRGVKHTPTSSQLEALARGRATAAANRAAKKGSN